MIDITPPMPETPPQLTVVDMVRASARKNPDQEALICGDERLNWSDFDTRINRVANALIARGIGKGDNVAVLSPNSIAYAELFMGIIRAGACITPLSTMAFRKRPLDADSERWATIEIAPAVASHTAAGRRAAQLAALAGTRGATRTPPRGGGLHSPADSSSLP